MRFIGRSAIDMVGGDRPAAVRVALDIGTSPAHRLEAADMRFGKGLGRGRIVPQMQVYRVAPGIRRGDLGHDAVGVAARLRARTSTMLHSSNGPVASPRPIST